MKKQHCDSAIPAPTGSVLHSRHRGIVGCVFAILLAIALFAGCSSSAEKVEADAIADVNPGPDSEGETHTPSGKLTVVVLGDFGTGLEDQKAVARGLETYCKSAGCSFVLGVGDLIYELGIQPGSKLPGNPAYDPQLDTKFLEPYANLNLVFYQVLGNHDWLLAPSAPAMLDFCKLRHGANCSGDGTGITKFPGWFLPSYWYSFESSNALFVGLDTEIVSKDSTSIGQQLDFVQTTLEKTKATWRIGFGHHPIDSNGKHGPTIGTRGRFIRNAVCHRFDVWVAGHDHHLEYLKDSCGVMLVVSGAGAKLRTYPDENRPKEEVEKTTVIGWAKFGFAVLHIDGKKLWFTFHDKDGTEFYKTDVRTKEPYKCDADGLCNQNCASDPDCSNEDCTADTVCNPKCTGDRDCRQLSCDCDTTRNMCDSSGCQSGKACTCDPDCWSPKTSTPCVADGHCDLNCSKGVDPDCASDATLCTP